MRRYLRLFSVFLGIAILTATIIPASLPVTDIPVYAAGTGKNLQLGAGTLSENAGASGAATVYYGKNDLTWRVIGYGTIGVASEEGKLALLAGSNMGSESKFNDVNAHYAGSTLKGAVDAIYSTTYFSEKEMGAIVRRELSVGMYITEVPYTDGIIGPALTGDDAPYLWPLSTKEAYPLYSNGSGITNIGATWWLRSPGDNNCIAYVNNNGSVFVGGNHISYSLGVRPAFNISLSSNILTSAATGGKDAGAVIGTLKEVEDYSGTDWKLTILDSSRNGFTASAGTDAILSVPEGYDSWTVPVTYSGAPSGLNEHISAILTDSDGTALYYGHIDNSVTIPTGLSEGTYTLNVFSEQCNGDKKTDLSSPISTITLKVKKEYDLIFDKNGGSGTMAPTRVSIGDEYTFPECGFTAPPNKTFYYWEMTGVDGINYPGGKVRIADNCLSDGKITVKAHWKDADKAVVKVKPKGKDLKYNGSAQELVSAGTAENGTMYYAVGNDDTAAPDAGWSEAVPKRKDTGTYYVWYKAKGSNGYADSDPGFTTAAISEKEPVKVEEVKLSRDKLTLTRGGSGKLKAVIVPDDAADQRVSWKSEDESITKITSDDKECTVTAVAAGETRVTVTTKDGGKEAVCRVIVEDEDEPDPVKPDPVKPDPVKPDPEPEKKPDKVPVTDPVTSVYPSSEDNFAPVAPGSKYGIGGNIKKLELDFSRVKESLVAPDNLKMTTICGSKFRTVAKIKDKGSVHADSGIKTIFNKKMGTVTVSCNKSGKATFEMEDGNSYTVSFTVDKPKPNKNESKIPLGTAPVTKTVKDLFGTTIDAGKLTILKEKVKGQATLSGNMLTVNPAEKDTIKLQYQYLNKKYKMTMKVK